MANQIFNFTFEAADTTQVSFGFFFNINKIDIIGTPIVKNIWNAFDEHGLLMSLERLAGERLADYKRRILDVQAHRANSTYLGLIYGITREFGLEITEPVYFHPIMNGDNAFLGGNPIVELDGPEVRIWGDYINDTEPDLTIDRWELTLQELVTAINAGTYIRAELVLSDYANDRAMTLVNQSSRKLHTQRIPNDTYVNLDKENIMLGSLIFSGTDSFITRKNSLAELAEEGDYYIDVIRGRLHSYSLPGTNVGLQYRYIEKPLRAIASPVIIHNLQSNEMKEKLFTQLVLLDGTTIDFLPTPLGADLINEFLSVIPTLYET